MLKLRSLFSFLNLLDSSGNMSFTNVAMAVCIAKLAMSSQLSSMDVAALLAVILNYSHKRSVMSVKDEN